MTNITAVITLICALLRAAVKLSKDTLHKSNAINEKNKVDELCNIKKKI